MALDGFGGVVCPALKRLAALVAGGGPGPPSVGCADISPARGGEWFRRRLFTDGLLGAADGHFVEGVFAEIGA